MSGAGRRRKHKKRQMGGKKILAKIGKVADVANKVAHAADAVNKLAKSTGIISKTLGVIPYPATQAASMAVKSAGYGKRRRKYGMRGHGMHGINGHVMHGHMMHGYGERLGDSVLGIGYQISHPTF